MMVENVFLSLFIYFVVYRVSSVSYVTFYIDIHFKKFYKDR